MCMMRCCQSYCRCSMLTKSAVISSLKQAFGGVSPTDQTQNPCVSRSLGCGNLVCSVSSHRVQLTLSLAAECSDAKSADSKSADSKADSKSQDSKAPGTPLKAVYSLWGQTLELLPYFRF